MKSLEYLMQLHPNKTAKQILAIQEKEKLADKKAQEKRDKAKLDFIKDINTNGGFYKGRFGYDQRYYYNITECHLDSGYVYGKVEKLVVFLGHKDGVVKPGDITIEKRKKTYERLETYGLEMCQRTTKKDYTEACEYLEGIAKFWNDVKII